MNLARRGDNIIKEHDPHPLGLVRFFEMPQTGIDVTSGKGRVVVSALARDKEFATAGVRVGDTITALGDTKVTDRESFRKLLRVHAAELSPFTLTLDRNGKKVVVRVTLPE